MFTPKGKFECVPGSRDSGSRSRPVGGLKTSSRDVAGANAEQTPHREEKSAKDASESSDKG